MNSKKDKKIKIDLFKDNELKIYSKRERTPEECKLPSDILVPINDRLIKTIRTSEDAVKHAIENYGDNNLQNHISDALNFNKEFKVLRAEVPSKTPKELSNYQKKYDRYNNKIKDDADKKIKEIGTLLASGQELFHGGKLIDTKEDNVLSLTSPLSTTFDPVIANIEAIHKGKAYDEGELNINIITNKNSKAKCFPFRHKGTKFGHEKEVLISSEAKLSVKEKKKISETTVSKHENRKNIEKIVPVYITKIEML
ncbi:hypothetical protein [Poseidonibacter ostreae]|uniref:Uncharacterized protein n=1 Tax=Poseidonibacter ostreae TaxID=2654171 RepID=A0ABQ6VH73_9BACT|nr:hypothetical protein [Poseidonibacter ostreae]KAB7885963.1 hypothetical protein GBG18_14850 [Poseidonibacter ostreae]